MTKLPTTRQLSPVALNPAGACEDVLARAFSTFNQAANSLESTYHALRTEVQKLRVELDGSNRKLGLSLVENQRTRNRLEDILRSLPCGVVVADSTGHVLRSNPAAQLLLKHLPDCQPDPAHEDWMPLIPQSFMNDGADELEYSFTARDPFTATNRREFSYGIRRSKLSGLSTDSTLHTDKESASGSEFSVGPADGEEWVYILRDRTAEKAMLREQADARRLTSLAEVSAVLAHEIRNPLASLELFAGLIARSFESGTDQLVWINHVRAGLRALGGTVNNVLQLYNQSRPDATPVDLGDVVKQSAEFLTPLADQWQVSIELSPLPEPCVVSGVAHQLQQVVLNIAMNAFRLSPPGSELHIKLARIDRATPPLAAISITDQGPGIPPDLLERIFEPGFTTRQDSPGIGLAVSRKIIEQHGGRLTACSAPGQGATFMIELPCSAPCESIGNKGMVAQSHILTGATR